MSLIVLGAGLGGLVLGQCLRAKNIPVILLEKASSSPRFNYGITLHRSVYQRLLPVLQMDEAKFLEKCSINIPGAQITSAAITTTFRGHRGRLESILREGLDIRWEQCVKGVEMNPQGISLHLENGPVIRSHILIGADGVHSLLRKSLIPKSCLNVLPYVVFNGRRSITIEEYQHGFQLHMAGGTIMSALHENMLFRIYVDEYTENDVRLGYTYSRPAGANDPLHRPDRPTTGAENIPEEFYAELSQFKHTKLGPGFADIFASEKVRQDRVLHWLMRSAMVPLEDVQDLADRGVWLIGDAANPTPILGGQGANEAFRDAIDLAEHLSNESMSDNHKFLEGVHQEWRRAINESERKLSEMHGLDSPLS